ncbi:MAG TPA: presqualene diphosphate synthase HpnD [Aestuariivirgaceae bacterium]|nr:presqualene diphosphate synthase HpnD [Aestuariivirgaceae bacterium]
MAASTSFYWAMRLLPPDRRAAIFAVYAFCRTVDDIADDEPDRQKRQAGLAGWRREIDALYAGEPRHRISRALLGGVRAFGLRRADFLAIIDGMEMDAEGPIVAPDRATLDLYCDRVASAVGRLCISIFGEPGAEGMAVAHHLGRALQLANIARDVDEDARIGRVYLPGDLLEGHGIPPSPPTGIMRHPAFPKAWREFAELARAQFVDAEGALARCDRHAMRPARIMMEVYRRNLLRMMALPDRAIADPSMSKRLVGKAEMLAIALRYGLF